VEQEKEGEEKQRQMVEDLMKEVKTLLIMKKLRDIEG
jgi:hypothetical protein